MNSNFPHWDQQLHVHKTRRLENEEKITHSLSSQENQTVGQIEPREESLKPTPGRYFKDFARTLRSVLLFRT